MRPLFQFPRARQRAPEADRTDDLVDRDHGNDERFQRDA